MVLGGVVLSIGLEIILVIFRYFLGFYEWRRIGDFFLFLGSR